MAETVEVLNAKVVVDASSVTQAQSQFNASVGSMASTYKGSFADKVKKLDEEMSQKFKDLNADITLTEKAIDQAAKTMPSLHQQLRGVRSAFADVATVAGMVVGPFVIAKQAFDELEKAAEFRDLVQNTRNMANVFGVDMQAIMDALDKASNNTLTAQNKFNAINKVLLEADDIVNEYADAHGIAVEAIDSHTRQLIIMNKVLEQSNLALSDIGGNVSGEADSFKRVNKELETLPMIISQFMVLSGIIGGLATSFGALNQVIAMFGQAATGYGGMIAAIVSLKRGEISAAEFTAQLKAASAAADETFRRMTQPMGIVYGGPQDEQTKLEESRLRRFTQQSEQANDDKLKKEQDARDKLNEIIISGGEKAQDSERSWMQDVIDLNIDHQQKLVEIALDGARKRQDIELDFARKIEDADLEYQQAIEEAQFQSASRRAEIEQRYQERLYQIQRRFQDSYWNAVKTRDAVALVEAVRERDRSIQDATRQRDQDIGNEDAQEQQRVQNAAIAHRRKLEDAQRYYERAMQDQRIAQQRAIEDENLEHQYREIELRRHFDWRIQEIDRAMNQELATAQVKYAQAEADYSAHLAQMAAIAAAYMGSLGIGGTGGGGYTNPRTRRRQSGGVDLVNSPTPFLAGEGGPELVVTVPMGGSQQMLPAPMSHTVSGDVRHQVDMITSNGMRGMEARIIAATMQALREVYRR